VTAHVIDVEAFDRRCIALHLARLVRLKLCPAQTQATLGGYHWVPSNVAIARRLYVSASSVSRARAGLPMPESFINAAVARLGMTRDELLAS
jgi:hypothetical protein